MLLDKKFNRIKNILLESISLLEHFENDVFYVFHCARANDINNIFKFGFERFFGGKGAGEMYGRGVYTTTDLRSSIDNAHKGTYGNVIIKAEVFNINKFLIFEKDIAQRVYGNNWKIQDQLNILLPQNVIKKLKETTYNGNSGSISLYDKLCDIQHFSSNNARFFYRIHDYINDKSIPNPYDFIEGFCFFGANDGHVAIVKDFKNLMPVEYSKDYGKSWIYGVTDDTVRHTKQDFDVEYKFGKKYKKTDLPSHGFAKVTNNQNKINYINKDGEELSKVWFNSGSKFDDFGNGFLLATVDYNNHILFLTVDGQIFEDPDDDFPLCDSSELPNYF